MPIVGAQCIIGNEKYNDTGIFLTFDDDDYSQGYHQIKEAFRALTKHNILQPHISENDYTSSYDGDNTGYNLHVFDIRYQKNFESAQAIKVEFKISALLPGGINGYALVSTNRLVSISSDVQQMFDPV